MSRHEEECPLISLIVPLYNAWAYLGNCLQSIVDQSYRNFEVLLVNDGSTDSSQAVCEQFCNADERFRLINKVNGGVSSARNLGLDHAAGDYVGFVDADDWLESDYLMQFSAAIDRTASLIMQDHFTDSGESSVKNLDMESADFLKTDFNVFFKDLNLLRNGHCCSKLYARNLIEAHGIRFNTAVSFAEDCLFMLEYLRHVEAVKFSGYAGYHYRKDVPSSLSKSHNLPGSELTGYVLFTRALENLRQVYAFDEATEAYTSFWLGKFFLRSIQSAYRGNAMVSLDDRIAAQRAAFALVNKHQMASLKLSKISLYTWVSLQLFQCKMFYTYDLYMHAFMKVRALKWRLVH